MNVVIISKEKYDEMVGKLNRLSDRGMKSLVSAKKESSAVGWITKMSANSCVSVRALCRRSATTVHWLTRKSGIRFSISRRMFKVLSGLWRTDERMPHGVAEPFDK